MSAKPLNCIIKKPVPLRIGDPRIEFHSGAAVIEVAMPNIKSIDLGDVTFKNSYTAFLSIKVRCNFKSAETSKYGDNKWITVLRRYQLMPDPHCEPGSQDHFTITRKQMNVEANRVAAVRFVLQQPSPVWNHFTIEDINLYEYKIDAPSPVSLPQWLLKNAHGDEEDEKDEITEIEGAPPIDNVSAGLQQLWALTESVRANQTASSLGRYDIDGCYEINLLSYT
ncbi:nicolin-1-like [Ptychodera flava]|uniref:nicolin-1-like n=1 Tax=Ptychodera flava TaxID=63121 RepID=UPI00396A6A44